MHICSIQACWCLLLKIEQLIVPFLTDTGASVNVLVSSVYSQLQQPPAICQAGSLQITGVGRNPVQVVGDLQLDVGVGEERIPTHMVVADIAKIQGILGIPFMKENECVLDISKGIMTYRGTSMEVVLFALYERNSCDLWGATPGGNSTGSRGSDRKRCSLGTLL